MLEKGKKYISRVVTEINSHGDKLFSEIMTLKPLFTLLKFESYEDRFSL